MLHTGDCRLILPELAKQGVRVQTCITSPPYYGLRDYGYPDQIGLESSVLLCRLNNLYLFPLYWSMPPTAKVAAAQNGAASAAGRLPMPSVPLPHQVAADMRLPPHISCRPTVALIPYTVKMPPPR